MGLGVGAQLGVDTRPLVGLFVSVRLILDGTYGVLDD